MEEFENIKDNVNKALIPRDHQQSNAPETPPDCDYDNISHYSKISLRRQKTVVNTIVPTMKPKSRLSDN